MRHANLVGLPGTESMNGHGYVQRSLIDLLPSSLKSLKITEIAEELIPDLVSDLLALVKLRQVSMPRLESIMLNVIVEEEPTEAVKGSIGVLAPESEGIGVCLNVRVRQSEDLTSPRFYEGVELAIGSCA